MEIGSTCREPWGEFGKVQDRGIDEIYSLVQSVILTTAKCIIIHRLIVMCLPGCEIFLFAHLRDRCSGGIADI